MKRVMFFIVGVGALCYGLYWLVTTINFVARAESASGTVVQLQRNRDSNGHIMYQPVVSFQTRPGAQVTFTDPVSGSGLAAYSIGDRVKVLYNPANPAQATIHSFSHVWLFPLVLILMGCGFTSAIRRPRPVRS